MLCVATILAFLNHNLLTSVEFLTLHAIFGKLFQHILHENLQKIDPLQGPSATELIDLSIICPIRAKI